MTHRPDDQARMNDEPLRHRFRDDGFVALASATGLAFALLLVIPSVSRLIRTTATDALVVVAVNAAIVLPTLLAYRRRGRQSRLYQALAVGEALVLQGSALWLVYRTGSAASPVFVLYVAFAAINVRFTEHLTVLRGLIGVPPALLALAFGLLRHDLDSALVSVVMGGFALMVFEAGVRANLRLKQVLGEREALEERIAAMRIHEERSRIARELHDGLGAELSALMWRAEGIRARLGEGHHDELGSLIERAGFSIDELRTVVWALRAPSTTFAALSGYVRDRVRELGAGRIELGFDVDEGQGEADIDGELAIDVIRVAQEAVRNAVRHGRPSRIRVGLHRDGRSGILTVVVEDDGVGVPAAALGRDRGGIANLRARAAAHGGVATVEPRAEGGTVVRVELAPVASETPIRRAR